MGTIKAKKPKQQAEEFWKFKGGDMDDPRLDDVQRLILRVLKAAGEEGMEQKNTMDIVRQLLMRFGSASAAIEAWDEGLVDIRKDN